MEQIKLIEQVEILVDGDGEESILMIHGWPDNSSLWDGQVAYLKGVYRCVRLTLPGFDEDRGRATYTLDEIVQLIKETVEKYGIEGKTILMVHDWGCFFGYEFYNCYPKMVSKIIGVDVGDTESYLKTAKIKAFKDVFAYQIPLMAAWKLGSFGGSKISHKIARNFDGPTPNEKIWWSKNWPYYMYWLGGKDAYRKKFTAFNPSCPFLFIYGKEKDLMFHDDTWAETLGRKRKNKTIGFDCDHWPMVRELDLFNKTVSDWLNPVTRA